MARHGVGRAGCCGTVPASLGGRGGIAQPAHQRVCEARAPAPVCAGPWHSTHRTGAGGDTRHAERRCHHTPTAAQPAAAPPGQQRATCPVRIADRLARRPGRSGPRGRGPPGHRPRRHRAPEQQPSGSARWRTPLFAVAPGAPVQPHPASLDGLGTQARQVGATGGHPGHGPTQPVPGLGCHLSPLTRHAPCADAGQRHPPAPWPAARAGGRGCAPPEPAGAGCQWALRGVRLRHLAAPHHRAADRHCYRRGPRHALPLAHDGPAGHGPLQRHGI